MNFTDLIGTTGVTILLLAYLLNLVKKLSQNSIVYIALNFIGAACACIASILLKYIPFIILEGAWTLVSFVVAIKYFIKAGNPQ